jgi:hypothetical protein
MEERDTLFYIEQVLSPSSIWSIDFSHMLSGLLGLGLAGSTSLFFSVFTGGPMMPRIGGFRGNDRGGGSGAIVMGILVTIGIAKTFYSMVCLSSLIFPSTSM